MNKTVTANISGVVFHIESDAYEKLNKYLSTIRNYFHDSDGKDEIMADIEARIAELFKEKLDEGKEVITMDHVQQVIGIMGEPEQYMDEEEAQQFSNESKRNFSDARFQTKKLFRDPDDNMLGGVCSGLGYYFGVDKLWFRAAFLIALFGFGSGILFYLILWIVIPAPKTTAEKLEMKGDPINVENIGNAIKDEFQGFKKKVNDGRPTGVGEKIGDVLYRVFDFLIKLVVFIFKFFAKVIAVIFILAAITGIITIIAAIAGGSAMLDINNVSVNSGWIADYGEIYFASAGFFSLGVIGIFLVTVIPLLGLLYGGLKILLNIPSLSKAVNISLLSLFAIGVIFISIAATSTAAQYSSEQRINETIMLKGITSDTLSFISADNSYSINNFGSMELFIEEDELFMNTIEVNVTKTLSDSVELKVTKLSKGPNRKEAGARAENILFDYKVENNRLAIDPFISVPLDDRFRDQEVKISIALPVGKSIYLDPSIREIIYDIENVTNTYDGKMMGHHWKMTNQGLKCTDCEWIIKQEEKEAKQNRLSIEINTKTDEDETI